MKLAVISDVHSNLHALRAVLDDIDRHGVKKVFCLGDLVGYGGNPKRVVDLARKFDLVLRGNHDDAVTYRLPHDFNPTAARAVSWTRAQLKADFNSPRPALRRWKFMRKGLKRAARVDNLMFAHGTPWSYFQYIDSVELAGKVLEKLPSEVNSLFIGHTHVAGVYAEDSDGFVRWIGPYAKSYPKIGTLRMIINVGSVGQPRDGDRRASYVLISGDRFYYRRVPYNIHSAVKAVKKKNGLPNYSGDRLLDGA